MMKINPPRPAGLIALLAFAVLAAAARAGAVKEYDFPGRYEKKSAQGFAVYQDFAFLCNDTALCRIYDLKTSRKIAGFALASTAESNHANCVSFGVEFPKGNKMFPAFYVSECWTPFRCFVESIDNSGARLIQTLQLKTGGADERVFDWVVDRGQKCLYALALIKGTKDTPQSIIISKLPLPSLDKPEVNFEKSDILDQFTVTFPNLTQGATVRDGFLYMPVGLHDVSKGTKEWRSREIIVINLKTKKIQRRIDLNASVPEEPEDADFHGDTLLLYCGQKGGLYKVDTKDPAATGDNTPRLHTVNIQSMAELQEYFHYSPDKDIIISGHRGGMMAGYPENCIASCEKTLSLMPSFFEIDPRLTKDGVLVLMHDATINRTTTGKGKVADYTYAELQQFYLKDRQKNATPYKIPTLDEVLEWGADKTVFNFDNKGVPWQVYSDNLKGKWAKYHNIILSVRSLEECLFYYQRNDNVMFCCEIGDMAQYEAYRDSGIPWNRIMAYVRYTMDPEQQAVHDLLHGHGVMCMIAVGPTADKVKPDEARIEAYKKELSRNPDIIETDYPADFAGLSRKRARK